MGLNSPAAKLIPAKTANVAKKNTFLMAHWFSTNSVIWVLIAQSLKVKNSARCQGIWLQGPLTAGPSDRRGPLCFAQPAQQTARLRHWSHCVIVNEISLWI